MSVSQESVRRWLTQVLIPYPLRDKALLQIQSTLQHFPSLSPKTESFTFDDGRTALLISLTGTIPVHYRALRYNIPITIWLPFEFPSEPPIIYLNPTNQMVIRRGTHVEPGGKCISGYFDSWQSKPEACSLNHLLEFLQDIFSREPPLYSKPKPPAPAYSSQPPSTTSTSQIPSTSSQQQQQQQQQPPRPPLPPQLARSVSTSPSPTNPDPQSRPPPPTRPPPPPPLYSQSSQSGLPSTSTPPPHHSPYQAGVRSNPHLLSSGSRSRTTPAIQHQPTPSLEHHDQSSQSTQSTPTTFTNPLTPNNHHSTQSIHTRPIEQQLDSLTISSSSKPNQNLLDDDPLDNEPQPNAKSPSNVPPPPRPPNPGLLSLRQSVHAKFRIEIERFKTSLKAEHQQLEILETDLLKGEPAILDEIARLEAVNDVCVNVGSRYRELVEQIDSRFIELTHHRKIVEVDELVCSTTVLYNQLWELIINDKVIEDLIYHLSKALNNSMDGSKIDLEKFLKRVRILGHEQFLIRVTINQICQQLGFSLSTSSTSSTSRSTSSITATTTTTTDPTSFS